MKKSRQFIVFTLFVMIMMTMFTSCRIALPSSGKTENIIGASVETESDSEDFDEAEMQKQSTEASTIATSNSVITITNPVMPKALTATQSDFQKLEELFNNDGGLIMYNDFNAKSGSEKDTIFFSISSGFFPAYKTYFNSNMWNENVIRSTYSTETFIPEDIYRWILKNIYGYTGKDISEFYNEGIYYRDGNIYVEQPPDETGLLYDGSFKYKSSELSDGQYIMHYTFSGLATEPYVTHTQEISWDYTVKATLKEVDGPNGMGKMRVWSIDSIVNNSRAY